MAPKVKEKFKKSEWIVILLALLIAFGSTWYYFFGRGILSDGDGQGVEKVGVLAESTGTVRREQLGTAVFEAIETNMPLFNEDTIVTAADSTARLELDDGSTIELGSNAMIRLQFESEFSLSGIHRVPKVDVVAGQVTGRAKTRELRIRSGEKVVSIAKESVQTFQPPVWTRNAPPPRPKPVAQATVAPAPPPPPPPPPEKISNVVLFSPKTGVHLKAPRGITPPSVPVVFEWQVIPPDTGVEMTLRSASDPGAEPIINEKFPVTPSGRGTFTWTAKQPGAYVWELRPLSGKWIAPDNSRARFDVDPEFEGIQLLEPLVGGQRQQSNLLKEKVLRNFDITLRWEGYPGVAKYRVELAKAPGGTPVLVREVEGKSISLNKDKVFTGEVYYQVSALVENGFRVLSPVSLFRFTFLPPVLTFPKDSAAIQSANRGKVLLTWQKTNFTEQYELEIALDPGFSRIHTRKVMQDNFFFMMNPPAGEYYWRVRSLGARVSSGMSAPRKFSVTEVRSAPRNPPR